METIEALIHRRSCRKYSDRPVEAEKLARIIEAGQYAPSGMGRQPVTFVAVTDPATVERLSQLNAQVMGSNSDPFYGAKTVVVVLVDRSVPTHLEDGSLAMGNLLNAAYALGVDSCWIHRAHEVFDSPEGLELLASWGLPADGSLRGVGNCILGYAEDTLSEAKPRRDNVVYVREFVPPFYRTADLLTLREPYSRQSDVRFRGRDQKGQRLSFHITLAQMRPARCWRLTSNELLLAFDTWAAKRPRPKFATPLATYLADGFVVVSFVRVALAPSPCSPSSFCASAMVEAAATIPRWGATPVWSCAPSTSSVPTCASSGDLNIASRLAPPPA